MPGQSRRLTGPSQDAESGVGLDLEQGLQGVALRTGKAGVDLSIDMTFGLQQGGRNQALDDTGSGSRNGASSQFLQQQAGERRAAGGGKRHREQPLGQFVLVGSGEGLEPVDGIQGVELIISGLRSGRVVGQDIRGKVELTGDENQYLPWHDFAGLQQAAGEPQGTELDGKAQAIVRPPAPRDDGEVGRAECVMPDQVGLGRRQREQCFKLGVGDGATTRHGGSVPIGVMSVQSSGEPSRSAGFRTFTPGCFNWDRRPRSTAGCPRPISLASARSAICAPSPSVPATRRWACYLSPLDPIELRTRSGFLEQRGQK